MAMAAGRWSARRFQAWRASFQSMSPGAETRPDMAWRRAMRSSPEVSMSMGACSAPALPSTSGKSLVVASGASGGDALARRAGRVRGGGPAGRPAPARALRREQAGDHERRARDGAARDRLVIEERAEAERAEGDHERDERAGLRRHLAQEDRQHDERDRRPDDREVRDRADRLRAPTGPSRPPPPNRHPPSPPTARSLRAAPRPRAASPSR